MHYMRWVLLLLATALTLPAGIHNLELVGQLALGPGFNADVWAHGNYAYVGTWGSGTRCPAAGVKVVDISNPASPRLVTQLGGHPNTSAEDVVVRHVETPFFKGDLLVLGLQVCNPAQPGLRGVELFDVTDPANPQQLAFFDVGSESRGVHELDLVARADGRVLALLATIVRFRLVEVTDPRNPVQLSQWNITERLNEPESSSKIDHSALASADGSMAFLSYWDAGVILLDIRDPANPRFLGRTGFAPGEEGNAHSVSVSPDNKLMLTADEDFNVGNAAAGYNDWGFLRVFDVSDPASPLQLSAFLTPNARTDRANGPPDNGTYSIHNPFLAGDLGFLSWYGDGVRVVDVADRRKPIEVGFYVPPDTPDPYNVFPARPQVWGVFVQPEKNLVLASDINFGLYLLHPAEPRAYGNGLVDAANLAPGRPVAPGSVVSLFGSQMAGATAAAAALPLPTQLAGTKVKVNGVAAPLFYASAGQINFLMPPQTALGTARVVVENLGRPGSAISVTVAPAAPGLFTLSQDGRGPAVVLRASDQSLVNASRPARAGEVLELFASGLGANPAPTVTIGGQPAEVLFAGTPSGFAGLYQVNVRIPAGARGTSEVVLTVAGRESNKVTLAVE